MKPILQQALCELLHGRFMLGGAVSLGDVGVVGVRHQPGGIDKLDSGRIRVVPPSDRLMLQENEDGFESGLLVRLADVIAVLSIKTGIPSNQVESSFSDWCRAVRDTLAKGGEVELQPLGWFRSEQGSSRFHPSDRLSVEVNHRHAGMQEIELKAPPSGSLPRPKRRSRAGLVALFMMAGLLVPAALYWNQRSGGWNPDWLESMVGPPTVSRPVAVMSAPAGDADMSPPESATTAMDPAAATETDPAAMDPAASPSADPAGEGSPEPDSPYGLYGAFDPDLRNAYSLVLFTFSNSERAANAAVPLLDAGLRLEIVTRWKGDQPFWLLCVGQFERREQAVEALQTLDEPYRSDYSVIQLP